MSSSRINLLDFGDAKIRQLHFAWFAFFITFIVWFSQAPMMASIKAALGLNDQQVKVLMILNVAITIPARILIGMLVDKLGPRLVYAGLLVLSGLVCFAYAASETYEQLALTRFLLGFVGAGFVIGIRLVGEWFPARQMGLAEGIYGGWGNFGSAFAAMTLPALAVWIGGDNGWRYAIACTGAIAVVYGFIFYAKARNTPKGSTYFKPKKTGALEVSSYGDLAFYLLMNVPMYAALAVLVWKLGPANLKLLELSTCFALYGAIAVLFGSQVIGALRVNLDRLKAGVPQMQRYSFKQVAILDLAYLATFGSELAVVSMLPLFFMETFKLSPVVAGLVGGCFAVANLVARPVGGLLSDKLGRRFVLLCILAGTAAGYAVMSQINASWALPVAVLVTLACSFFVQGGCGAVFAVVPLVQRRMTGQISGMVGAYGNVGGVMFLTVLSFVDAHAFFMVLASVAAVTFIAVSFLDEPRGHMVEVAEDGTVQLIDVA